MNIGGKTYVNLEELEPDAFARIEPLALGYYKSGSETECTLQENARQFQKYLFIPRILVDVSHVSTECTILGRRSALPLMIAPMAMQKLAHPLGECGMAKGASSIPMILSTMSTTSMEDVAQAAVFDLYFQLYCLKDRDVTARMIQSAEQLGYKGIVITVDAPRLGKRESDERQQFTLPEPLRLEILQKHGIHHGSQSSDSTLQSKFGSEFSTLIDDSLTWDVISFVRSITTLPIILKGILSAEDAKLAVKHKVDAIVVSNHGGRQLDYAVPTLLALEQIAPVVKGKVEIWVDGGVRRGTDIVKCLCLGADAVLIGRPFLWALALGGDDGVSQAIRMLQQDVERTMSLMGVTRPDQLLRGHVHL